MNRQEELFTSFMRAANGYLRLEVKSAATNVLLALITKNSSNYDEAAAQWNELSNFIEENLIKRYSRGLVDPEECVKTFTKLNGDR